MRVVHVSMSDQSGGAARAAQRLHMGLRRIGVDSVMYVRAKSGDDPAVRVVGRPANLPNRLRRWARYGAIELDYRRYGRRRPAGYELFSDDRSHYGADFVRHLPPADVVTLHWVARFLDFGAFFEGVPRRVPVVWRLSDMNAFTGGCHYDDECGRYVAACGACPQLGSSDLNDLSAQVLRRKRAAMAAVPPGRLTIVALNRWIMGEVRRSSLFRDVPVHYIPNGLDTDAFAPRDRANARAVLGVPQDARVVLFVAANVTSRRKGFGLLAEALAGMTDTPGLFLISIGRGSTAVDPRIPHLGLGTLNQERLLSLVYSAADVFVIPSLQDNMPSTVLEAIACGTPAVGFDVGGVAEMVRPGETGLLVPKGDVAGLREALGRILGDEALRRGMGARCRAVALAEYDQRLQARRYLELYEGLVAPGAAAMAAGAAGRSSLI